MPPVTDILVNFTWTSDGLGGWTPVSLQRQSDHSAFAFLPATDQLFLKSCRIECDVFGVLCGLARRNNVNPNGVICGGRHAGSVTTWDLGIGEMPMGPGRLPFGFSRMAPAGAVRITGTARLRRA